MSGSDHRHETQFGPLALFQYFLSSGENLDPSLKLTVRTRQISLSYVNIIIYIHIYRSGLTLVSEVRMFQEC